MLTCPHCHKRLLHVRRRPFEKLLYSDVYACSGCKKRIGARRASFIFLFSKHTRCIVCGSPQVARLAKPDRVNQFTTNRGGLVQRWVGAPVWRCSPCRVQFYDWRPAHSTTRPHEK